MAGVRVVPIRGRTGRLRLLGRFVVPGAPGENRRTEPGFVGLRNQKEFMVVTVSSMQMSTGEWRPRSRVSPRRSTAGYCHV